MTYANFKDTVLSYLNRAGSAVITSSNVDLVLVAMNDARRAAQRAYSFEMLSMQAFVQMSMIGKSFLTDFRATPASSGTLVKVKRVDSVFQYSSTTISGTTVYYPTQRIELRRRNAIRDFVPVDPNADALTSPQSTEFAFIQGSKIYHTNLTELTWVMCDVIEFKGDHPGGTIEDIWLTYHTDWLRLATLAALNTWLKDNERTVIDQQLLERLWADVKQYDAQQAVSTDDLSLE